MRLEKGCMYEHLGEDRRGVALGAVERLPAGRTATASMVCLGHRFGALARSYPNQPNLSRAMAVLALCGDGSWRRLLGRRSATHQTDNRSRGDG